MQRILFGLAVLFLLANLAYALGERPAKVAELQTNNFVGLRGDTKIYAPKNKVNPNNLIKAVEKAGYKATLAR